MRWHRSFTRAAGMSRWKTFGAAVLLSAVGVSAAHGAEAYEAFDYAPGTPNGNWTGGSGFRTKWLMETTDPARIVAGSLSDPTGTLATSGGHMEGGRDTSMSRQLNFPADGGKWLSFLMSRNHNQVGWTGLRVQNTGGGAGPGFQYYIGEPGSGPGDGQIVFGTGDDNTYAMTGVPFTPNVPVFLVAYFGYEEGNNYAMLYVNPTPGVLPTGGTRFDGGPVMNLVGATLSTTTLVPQTPGLGFALDEVRTGDTYLEVAPVPEPGAAAGLAAAAQLLARPRRRRVRARLN